MQKKYNMHACDRCGKEILYRDSDPYPFTGITVPHYNSSTDSVQIVKKYLCKDCLISLSKLVKEEGL